MIDSAHVCDCGDCSPDRRDRCQYALRLADLHAAVKVLLELKDGPRDSNYYLLIPAAWDVLRAQVEINGG